MRSFKGLIVPLIIMVLLVTGVIIYFAVSSSNTEDPADNETTYAFTASTDEVKAVSVWTKESGKATTKVSKIKVDDLTYDFAYEGEDKDPAADYSQEKLSAFATMLMVYAADKVADNVPLTEYGLDDPDYKVYIDLENGETHTVSLGNLSPDGNNVYINVDGKNEVFMTAALKVTYAKYKGKDFLEPQILDIDMSGVSSVRFVRTTDGLDLSADVSYDSNKELASYHIVNPYDINASEYFASLVEQIAKLEISSYIDISAADKASYGLDKPAFSFIFEGKDGSSKKVYLSKNLADKYYGYIEGDTDHFYIDRNQIQLLEAPELALIEAYVAYYNVSELSSIKGTCKDQDFTLKLDVKDDEAISDDGADVELDGRNAKVFNEQGRSYCAMFFESLVCMPIAGSDVKASPTLNDPVSTFSFIGKNYQTKTIDLVKRNNETYYVFADGNYTGFYVHDDALNKNGGQDTYSYGVWEAYKLLNTAISENMNGIYNIPVV